MGIIWLILAVLCLSVGFLFYVFGRKAFVCSICSLVNAEAGMIAWRLAGCNTPQIFCIASLFGTLELCLWYFVGDALMPGWRVVFFSGFAAIGIGYLLLTRWQKLIKKARLIFTDNIFRLRVGAILFSFFVLFLSGLYFFRERLATYMRINTYIAVLIMGAIPTLFSSGILLIKKLNIEYGFLVLLAGNIFKMFYFTFMFQRLGNFLGVDGISQKKESDALITSIEKRLKIKLD